MPFTFLHPLLFAIGAGCISIPIIIHLLKRRRRVITWGAMRFLEEAYRKRRRIITLEQLLLLTLRCLLVLFIALGVGSIVFGQGGGVRVPKTLVVVLDDSIGSARIADNKQIIERNKQHAIEQIDGLDPMLGDRVALISASRPARAIVLPASDDLGSVRALIEQTPPTDAALDLDGVLKVLSQIERDPDKDTNTDLLIASDARSFEHAIEEIVTEATSSSFDTLVLPEPDSTRTTNVGIRSAILTRKLVIRDGISLPESVDVQLVRSGTLDSDQSTQVRVMDHRGTSLGSGTYTWRAGEREASVPIALQTQGLQIAAASSALMRVELNDDANLRDNSASIAIPVRNSLRVAVIDRPRDRAIGAQSEIAPSRWVRAALAPRDDLGVQITSIDASQASARLVPGLDAIFVLTPDLLNDASWDRIERLNEQGVMVIVTPASEGESLGWFDRIRAMHPDSFGTLLQFVDHDPAIGIEPDLQRSSVLSGISSDFESLASAITVQRFLQISTSENALAAFSDGSPLAVQIPSSNNGGMFVVFSIPFDLRWTDLPARPMFVAMMQELVRQGVGLGESRNPIVAGTPIRTANEVAGMRVIDEEHTSRPSGADLATNQYAGAIAMRDAQGATRAVQVVHPDAMGALADPVDRARVEEQLARFIDADTASWIGDASSSEQQPASSAGASGAGHRLALWMLMCALIIAIIEFILARVFTSRLIASERAMGAEGRGVRA